MTAIGWDVLNHHQVMELTFFIVFFVIIYQVEADGCSIYFTLLRKLKIESQKVVDYIKSLLKKLEKVTGISCKFSRICGKPTHYKEWKKNNSIHEMTFVQTLSVHNHVIQRFLDVLKIQLMNETLHVSTTLHSLEELKNNTQMAVKDLIDGCQQQKPGKPIATPFPIPAHAGRISSATLLKIVYQLKIIIATQRNYYFCKIMEFLNKRNKFCQP